MIISENGFNGPNFDDMTTLERMEYLVQECQLSVQEAAQQAILNDDVSDCSSIDFDEEFSCDS